MIQQQFIHSVRLLAVMLLLSVATTVAAGNYGVPFIRNFGAEDYNAHNRNYDIACDAYGSVFVANFEGLLYYDGSTWRKIHTPGISRVTRIARGDDGRIWVGGFNVFGYLVPDKRGCLGLHTIVSDKGKRLLGEVDIIKMEGRDVYVHTSSGDGYRLRKNNELQPLPKRIAISMLQTTDSMMHINAPGMAMSLVRGEGVMLRRASGSRLIIDRDGLCSTAINSMTFDKNHSLWAATDHGVFTVEVPSPFSRLTEAQGLKGEVYSVGMIGNTVYFGTLQGVFRLENGVLTQMDDLNLACWQIIRLSDKALLAATANGLYRITRSGMQRLTDGNTLAVCEGEDGRFYTGETDGVYEVADNGLYRMIANIEKCVSVKRLGRRLRVETLYGELWDISLGERIRTQRMRANDVLTEPKVDFTDSQGRKWYTDSEGKNLRVSVAGKLDKALTAWVRPMAQKTINTVYVNDKGSLWIGGDFGALNYDLSLIHDGKVKMVREPLYIRQVVAFNDSVLWGGYSPKDMRPLKVVKNIELPSSCRSITIHFSAGTMSVFCSNKYRYRINGGRWSAWTDDTYVRFDNMQYGSARFEVQALDLFGMVSDTAVVEWYLEFPFYLKWWAVLSYVLLFLFLVRSIVLYRMKKLKRDKMRLEKIVNERTAELSTALDDLQRTQADLVRMERTATAGKLTQGLIDRILNPINYINNFSKLTSGLAKELHEDIKDERQNMSEENYEDCEDIITMMTTNLEKIEEHGVNTTRTLRAMEAMLKNHIGTMRSVDMVALCRQVMDVTAEYHRKSIDVYGIAISSDLPQISLMHEVDADAINRALAAVLANAIYAVVKKQQRQNYKPVVALRLTKTDDTHIEIVVHDNGIGIEDTIINKVYDPFFTTKPTSEAAGVGLYLAKEIIQDHNGSIAIRSVKDQFTDVIISL